VISIPFFAYIFVRWDKKAKLSYLQKSFKSLRKVSELQKYILILMHFINNKKNSIEDKILLEGILRYSIRISGHDSNSIALDIAYSRGTCFLHYIEILENIESDIRWNYLLKAILEYSINRFPKCSSLHLLNSYLFHCKFHNNLKAVNEMILVSQYTTSIREQFCLFHLKKLIEKDMHEDDLRNLEAEGLKVGSVIEFQDQFLLFQNKIEESTVLYIEFWKELASNNPNGHRLQEVAHKIAPLADEIKHRFDKLEAINSMNVKLFRIYGHYLSDVLFDSYASLKVLERYRISIVMFII